MVTAHTRVKLVDIANRNPPINPVVGQVWVDISRSDLPAMKVWTGGTWYNPLQPAEASDRLVEIILLG